jgi:hypothetical protein
MLKYNSLIFEYSDLLDHWFSSYTPLNGQTKEVIWSLQK